MSAGSGGWRYYRITVPDGTASLGAELHAPFAYGDAAIYMRRGAPPTLDLWDVRSAEQYYPAVASVANPLAGDWFIGIYARTSYAGVSLTAKIYPNSDATINAISDGQTVSDLAGASNSWRYYKVTVPPGTRGLDLSIDGTSGSARLYAKFAELPTTSAYDLVDHWYYGETEDGLLVVDPTPGEWYIGIYGNTEYYGVSFGVELTAGSEIDSVNSGEMVSGLAGGAGTWRYYRMHVPMGTEELNIATSGGGSGGNVDLYLSPSWIPSLHSWDERSNEAGSNEQLVVENPEAGGLDHRIARSQQLLRLDHDRNGIDGSDAASYHRLEQRGQSFRIVWCGRRLEVLQGHSGG